MADTLTICGVSYSVSFSKGTCDGPCLTLTSPTASGASYTAVRESCGPNYAVFALGNPAVCTGDPACGGPAANLLRLKVQWVSCLWDGPGWYCVRDCGGGPCEARELLEGDQYDPAIEICSGPFETEGAAQEACPLQTFDASCSAVEVHGTGVPNDPEGLQEHIWAKFVNVPPGARTITMWALRCGGIPFNSISYWVANEGDPIDLASPTGTGIAGGPDCPPLLTVDGNFTVGPGQVIWTRGFGFNYAPTSLVGYAVKIC